MTEIRAHDALDTLLFEKSSCIDIGGELYLYNASIRNADDGNEEDLLILFHVGDSKGAKFGAIVTLDAHDKYYILVVGYNIPTNDSKLKSKTWRLVHEIFTEYRVQKMVDKIFWNVCAHQELCHIVPSEISEYILAFA